MIFMIFIIGFTLAHWIDHLLKIISIINLDFFNNNYFLKIPTNLINFVFIKLDFLIMIRELVFSI